MAKKIFLNVILLLFFGCSDEPEEIPVFTASIDGVAWEAKEFVFEKTNVNGKDELETLTAIANDNTAIILSISLMELSPTNLSAEFRKKGAVIQDFHVEIVNPQTFHLTWSTTSESNVEYYIIEQSLNLSTWEMAGYTQANGSSNETQHYAYSIYAVFDDESKVFYRIRVLDFDGTSTYSEPLEIKLLYEAHFRDDNGFRFQGYNGKVELSEFNVDEQRISGTFYFDFKKPDGTEVQIRNGTIEKVSYRE